MNGQVKLVLSFVARSALSFNPVAHISPVAAPFDQKVKKMGNVKLEITNFILISEKLIKIIGGSGEACPAHFQTQWHYV